MPFSSSPWRRRSSPAAARRRLRLRRATRRQARGTPGRRPRAIHRQQPDGSQWTSRDGRDVVPPRAVQLQSAPRAWSSADSTSKTTGTRGPPDASSRRAAGGIVVVLQQGPSALPESQVNLREWTARFDGAIRATGAPAALYHACSRGANRRDAFDAVSRSYARAAEDVGGMLLPSG